MLGTARIALVALALAALGFGTAFAVGSAAAGDEPQHSTAPRVQAVPANTTSPPSVQGLASNTDLPALRPANKAASPGSKDAGTPSTGSTTGTGTSPAVGTGTGTGTGGTGTFGNGNRTKNPNSTTPDNGTDIVG